MVNRILALSHPNDKVDIRCIVFGQKDQNRLTKSELGVADDPLGHTIYVASNLPYLNVCSDLRVTLWSL